MTLVLLKRWTTLFNPEKESIGVGPIWVQLPSPPLQFWSKDIFRIIRDDLDTYLDHDRSYMDTGILAMARILVYLDTRDGLVESYRFQLGTTILWQELDYDGIPFRCRRCHKVSHLYKSFPLVTGIRPNPSRSFVAAYT